MSSSSGTTPHWMNDFGGSGFGAGGGWAIDLFQPVFADPPTDADGDDDDGDGDDNATDFVEERGAYLDDDFEELMALMRPETTTTPTRGKWEEFSYSELVAQQKKEDAYARSIAGATGARATTTTTKDADDFAEKRDELVGGYKEYPLSAFATEAAVDEGPDYGRNVLKELFQRGKRALGLSGKAREMRVYGIINPAPGSFGAGFLDMLNGLGSDENLQVALGADGFSKVFSSLRVRTEQQKCSIYVHDKSVRQLLNNKRINVNLYMPLETSGSPLTGGANYTIFEYDLRSRRGAQEKASTFYGLFKSSILHKPDVKGKKAEDPMMIKSAAIVLNFGRQPEVTLLPQIAGNIGDARMQEMLAQRLWYSTGVPAKGTPMAVFRFSQAETPMEQQLDFVYLVVPQADARPGIAELLDAINASEETRAATTTALYQLYKECENGAPTLATQMAMKRAARWLGEVFCATQQKVGTAAGGSMLEMRTLPGPVAGADPDLVADTKEELRNFLGYLGTATTSEQPASFTDLFPDAIDRQRLDDYCRTHPTRMACLLSQMIYTARCHVLGPLDAQERMRQLWDRRAEALKLHF